MKNNSDLISRYGPEFLKHFVISKAPAVVLWNNTPVSLEDNGVNAFTGEKDGLEVSLHYEYSWEYDVLSYWTELKNHSEKPVTGIHYVPIELFFKIDARKNLPRIRHLSGSDHYNGIYPSTAYRLHEEVFMTHDHCKRVVLDGNCSKKDTPVLQFAICDESCENMSGFFIGMEWSASWSLSAGWNAESWFGQNREDYFFTINGSMALLDLEVKPGESVELPKVHMGFFEGNDFTILENKQRRFISGKLSPKVNGTRFESPVSCNSWFGIYLNLNYDLIKKQIYKAAELGCEYYILDAGWYHCPDDNFTGGIGNWETADPRKFIHGYEDITELSNLCRSLGMKFGSWMIIQSAHKGSDAYVKHPELFRESLTPDNRGLGEFLKLETEEGVDYAVEMLSKLIDDWGLKWYKHESVPEDELPYNRGYNEVLRRIMKKYPDLIIEDCNGGGMRLDLNMMNLTHTCWLSDHTSNPEVCRFMDTSALHFWPHDYLILAVTAFMGRAGETATSHELLSRMVGVPQFMGDVASWTPEETSKIRKMVDTYKEIRHLKNQDVFFPLRQPKTIEDWDAVLFGDGSAQQQLLFVFRTFGKKDCEMELCGTGEWKQIMGDEATIVQENKTTKITLPNSRSSALFIR